MLTNSKSFHSSSTDSFYRPSSNHRISQYYLSIPRKSYEKNDSLTTTTSLSSSSLSIILHPLNTRNTRDDKSYHRKKLLGRNQHNYNNCNIVCRLPRKKPLIHKSNNLQTHTVKNSQSKNQHSTQKSNKEFSSFRYQKLSNIFHQFSIDD